MSLQIAQPGWLLLFLPLTGWWLLLLRRTRYGAAWRDLVDPHLLEAQLVAPTLRGHRALPLAMLAIVVICLVLALAGIELGFTDSRLDLTTPLLLGAAALAAAGFRRGWLA